MTIGFIGLGAMGLPVARRLAGAGHRLVVFDQAPHRLAAAGEIGGVECARGVPEVAARAEVLFTCLASPAAGEAVLGPLQKPGLVVCDLSTVGPTLAIELQADPAGRGIGYVECPMLGGVDEAAAASSTSSSPATRRLARLDLFPLFSRASRHVGPERHGHRYKTVQNGLGQVQLSPSPRRWPCSAAPAAIPPPSSRSSTAGRGMAATPLFRAKAPMMLDPSPP